MVFMVFSEKTQLYLKFRAEMKGKRLVRRYSNLLFAVFASRECQGINLLN